jgi:hypothetical protein
MDLLSRFSRSGPKLKKKPQDQRASPQAAMHCVLHQDSRDRRIALS